MKDLSTEEKKTKWDKVHEIGDQCLMELLDSYDKFPDFNSCHEGYAVLKEEVDELWDAIKMKPRPTENVREEAIQVAAMAMKMVHYIDENELKSAKS